MKKGKFIGLGITVLALGVVAGAIGAQKATEVKADGVPANVYIAFGADSAWKAWGAGVGNTKVHFFDNEGVGKTSWPGAAVTETEIDDVTYFKVAVPSGSTKMLVNVWGGDTNQNKTEDLVIPTDGKNLFTVTSNNKSALQTGAWTTLDTSSEQEVVDDESTHVFKLVGTGTAALGNWNKTNSTLTMTDAGVSGYLKKIESVSLAADDKFKVVDVNLDGWYAGSFLATDATREKIDFDADSNFKVLTAGTYDIYVKSSEGGHKVAILTHGEELANVKEETPLADDYYILGIGGDWTPRHGVRNDKESGTNIAEFHNVALAANDTFKVVYVENGAGVTYYGYDSFVNLSGGANMTGKIEEAATDQNFEVKTAGTYSIYLFDDSGNKKISIYDENYSEVYKAYLDGVEAGTLTVNPENENELMLTDVDLTAGDELVIKFNGTPLTVSPKAGDGNNVALSEDKLIVRQTAENVGMYLSQNAMSAWEIWVDGYVTSDIEVVDNFVATYITPYIDEAWKTQTAEQRVASCTEKYNRAKTAFDALTQDQQDLFTVNSRYSDAYAAYSRWAAVVGGGAAINVKGMTEASKTAIIVATVSVGAIAAAAGFVFLRKKRNNA